MAGSADRAVDLSWIVVSHESARDLPVLLRSLVAALGDLARRGGLSAELIVVDNGSSDGSADLAARLVPWATRLANAENRGYGAAINQALAVARGRWVAFGNADLFVPRGALSALPRVLAAQPPEVAIVGPALFGSDGRRELSAGRFPSLASLLAGLLRACHRRKYLNEGRHVAGPVDWVTGACLFARADRLREVGGFNEDYFLYYEDVDLARRLAARKFVTVYEPELAVVHVRPHHGRPPVPAIEELVRESRRAYFARHRRRWELLALGLLGRLEPVVRRRSRVAPVPPPLARPHPGVVATVPVAAWHLPRLPEPAAMFDGVSGAAGRAEPVVAPAVSNGRKVASAVPAVPRVSEGAPDRRLAVAEDPPSSDESRRARSA